MIKYYPPIPKSTMLRHRIPVYYALTTHVDTTSESMNEHGEIFVTRYEESYIGGVHIVEVYEDNALLPRFRAWLETPEGVS